MTDEKHYSYDLFRECITSSAEETEVVGGNLAASVQKGNAIALIGNLGAGKTTFARGFVHALGYNGPVRSPSFTLSNRYPSTPPVTHIDFYRLEESSELMALDLLSESEDHILLVEWADRFVDELNYPDWRVELDWINPNTDERKILIFKRV